MPFKSESLLWPDQLNMLQSLSTATRAQQKDALKVGDSQLTSFRAINACFDAKAIEKVRLAAKNDPPFVLSFASAEALSGLKTKVKAEDLHAIVHTALDVILSRKLATRHITALVKWIKAGHPASEFDPTKTQETEVTTPDTKTEDSEEPEDDPTENENAPTTKTPKGHSLPSPGQRVGNAIAVGIDSFLNLFGGQPTSTKASPSVKHSSKGSSYAKASGDKSGIQKTEKWFAKHGKEIFKYIWRHFFKLLHRLCKETANYLVPVRHFEQGGRKKHGGSSSAPLIPLLLHWFVYSLCQLVFWWVVAAFVTFHFVPHLWPCVQWPFRFLAHLVFVQLPGQLWPLAVSHWVIAIVAGLLLFIGISSAYKARPVRMTILAAVIFGLWYYGRGSSIPVEPTTGMELGQETDKVSSSELGGPASKSTAVEATNPQSTAAPSTTQKTAEAVQPIQAWTAQTTEASTGVDQNYLEMEITAIPQYSRVKAFPFQPVNMNADMAAHRLADLQDSDKYSVWWGKDRQKVVSLNPTSSNCTLNFQSGLEGLLGGPSQMEFYWEDVQAIHCSEITTQKDQTTKTIYQISLVISDAKKPLTVQCDSAVELGHLVSALEFWLKTSRGTTAPLIGLPYLYQGLWLKGDNEVSVVWADSPAGRGKLNPGDMLWCVGGDTGVPRHYSDLKAGLRSSAPMLYVVSPDDWEKAEMEKDSHRSDVFNPNRRRVVLAAS